VKKTTIELPDELADQARQCAAVWGTTMRSLIEEGLRREIERRSSDESWTPGRDLVFKGDGLTKAAEAMSWAEIREMANER